MVTTLLILLFLSLGALVCSLVAFIHVKRTVSRMRHVIDLLEGEEEKPENMYDDGGDA